VGRLRLVSWGGQAAQAARHCGWQAMRRMAVATVRPGQEQSQVAAEDPPRLPDGLPAALPAVGAVDETIACPKPDAAASARMLRGMISHQRGQVWKKASSNSA